MTDRDLRLRKEAYRKQINILAKTIRAELPAHIDPEVPDFRRLTKALNDFAIIMSPATGRISGAPSMRVLARIGRTMVDADVLADHGRLLSDAITFYLRGDVHPEDVAILTGRVRQLSANGGAS